MRQVSLRHTLYCRGFRHDNEMFKIQYNLVVLKKFVLLSLLLISLYILGILKNTYKWFYSLFDIFSKINQITVFMIVMSDTHIRFSALRNS